MQAFIETRYEYHWSPLIGCLSALLHPIPSHVVGAVTGLCYRPPDERSLPPSLAERLSALGARAKMVDRERPNRVDRFRARRRLRSELQRGRAAAVFGVGESAFGPTWGLIVGLDDERQAWRRDGPMTEQVSPWLAESALRDGRLQLITLERSSSADATQWASAAAAAWQDSVGVGIDWMTLLIEQLDSAVELEPQRFAYDIQALAANWGEAAAFWREHGRATSSATSSPAAPSAAQAAAISLSRCATLFPYPMGGQPNHPGVRNSAAGFLREAVDSLSVGH